MTKKPLLISIVLFIQKSSLSPIYGYTHTFERQYEIPIVSIMKEHLFLMIWASYFKCLDPVP